MYNAGKSYGRFSQTISAVTACDCQRVSAAETSIRRMGSGTQLGSRRTTRAQCSDAFVYHDCGNPLAMLWGWIKEAAIIAYHSYDLDWRAKDR